MSSPCPRITGMTLPLKVMKDCDAQIETLLSADQRRKLDKELARN